MDELQGEVIEFSKCKAKRTSRQVHRRNLVQYLGDPENEWPSRTKYKDILGISEPNLYHHFPPVALTEIEAEAQELRRASLAHKFSLIDNALISKAMTGDVQAIKLAYQRLEGWSERSTQEIQAHVSNDIHAPSQISADVKAMMIRITGADPFAAELAGAQANVDSSRTPIILSELQQSFESVTASSTDEAEIDEE